MFAPPQPACFLIAVERTTDGTTIEYRFADPTIQSSTTPAPTSPTTRTWLLTGRNSQN